MEAEVWGMNLQVGFPGGTLIKNPPAHAGDMGSIPGSGRSPRGENGNLLQYCRLENFMDRGAWWATVHGVAMNQTWLSDWAHICIYKPRTVTMRSYKRQGESLKSSEKGCLADTLIFDYKPSEPGGNTLLLNVFKIFKIPKFLAICYSSPLKSTPSSWVEGKSIPPIDQANSHSSHSIHQQCQHSDTSQIWHCLTTCTAATHSGHHQPFPGSKQKLPNWPPHCHPRAVTVHSPHSHWDAFLETEIRWSHSAQPSYDPRINSKLRL